MLDLSEVAVYLQPTLQAFQKIAFVFLTLGFLFLVFKASEPKEYLMAIAMATASVALIAEFPTLFNELREGIWEQSATNNQQIQETFITLKTGITTLKTNQKGNWIPSVSDIGPILTVMLCEFIFAMAHGARLVVEAVQQTLALIMVAFSPLMLGFILLGATRSLAINFLMLSLSICLWPFSFVIGDIIIYKNVSELAAYAGIEGGFTAAAMGASVPWAVLILIMAFGIIIFLTYLLCPVFLSWIMSGVNPAPILAGLGLAAAGSTASQVGKTVSPSGGGGGGGGGGNGSDNATKGALTPIGDSTPSGNANHFPNIGPMGGNKKGGGTPSDDSASPTTSLTSAPLTNSDGSPPTPPESNTGSGSAQASPGTGPGSGSVKATEGQKKEGGGMVATQGAGNSFTISSGFGQGVPTSHYGNIGDNNALSMGAFQHLKERNAIDAFDGKI